MKLTWLTDLHLDFIDDLRIQELMVKIENIKSDALLIGGDTGEAGNLIRFLQLFEKEVSCPVYYVLGNHDYYHQSISMVREQVKRLQEESKTLFYLPETGIVKLTKKTALIGHGCWGDGRYGDFLSSRIRISDYDLIEELSKTGQYELLDRLNKLGDEAAEYLRVTLKKALKRFDHVILLTHVPPFLESTWHEYHASNNEWVPHFSCKAVGQVLLKIMKDNRDKQLTVLCGHTHSAGMTWILSNLLVKTGAAKYGKPDISEVFLIKEK